MSLHMRHVYDVGPMFIVIHLVNVNTVYWPAWHITHKQLNLGDMYIRSLYSRIISCDQPFSISLVFCSVGF